MCLAWVVAGWAGPEVSLRHWAGPEASLRHVSLRHDKAGLSDVSLAWLQLALRWRAAGLAVAGWVGL